MSRTPVDCSFSYCPFCGLLFENEQLLAVHNEDVHMEDA